MALKLLLLKSYYHIVCSPNTSTTVEAFEATLPLEPQVRTWGSAVAAPIWVLLILSNVGGGVFTILFAILFHGHMEATDVGATASSMPGLRNRNYCVLGCHWQDPMREFWRRGGLYTASSSQSSRKEDNDIGGAEKLGRLILIITMLRGKNFWLKMERKVMPSIYIYIYKLHW
jgi:hypothetical protein